MLGPQQEAIEVPENLPGELLDLLRPTIASVDGRREWHAGATPLTWGRWLGSFEYGYSKKQKSVSTSFLFTGSATAVTDQLDFAIGRLAIARNARRNRPRQSRLRRFEDNLRREPGFFIFSRVTL
jgi:hypothetical protein